MKHKFQWFKFVYYGVLTLFGGIMLFVTYISFTHRSGSTGMDMAQIQKTRYEFTETQRLEAALSSQPKSSP